MASIIDTIRTAVDAGTGLIMQQDDGSQVVVAPADWQVSEWYQVTEQATGRTVQVLLTSVSRHEMGGVEFLMGSFVRPLTTANARPAGRSICDHYETDTHGICYACGAYVLADDAARY